MSLRIPDNFKVGDRVLAVAGTPLKRTGAVGTIIRKNVRHNGYRVRWDERPYAFSPAEGDCLAPSLRHVGWAGDEVGEGRTRVFVQATTGKVHRRRNCGVTSRTRYSHIEQFMTPNEIATRSSCARCWS